MYNPRSEDLTGSKQNFIDHLNEYDTRIENGNYEKCNGYDIVRIAKKKRIAMGEIKVEDLREILISQQSNVSSKEPSSTKAWAEIYKYNVPSRARFINPTTNESELCSKMNDLSVNPESPDPVLHDRTRTGKSTITHRKVAPEENRPLLESSMKVESKKEV